MVVVIEEGSSGSGIAVRPARAMLPPPVIVTSVILFAFGLGGCLASRPTSPDAGGGGGNHAGGADGAIGGHAAGADGATAGDVAVADGPVAADAIDTQVAIASDAGGADRAIVGDAGVADGVIEPDAAGAEAIVDGADGPLGGIARPRLIEPLSTATVTTRTPTLRWVLAAGTDGAHVQVCHNRSCVTEVMSFDIDGSSGVPPVALPTGLLFWRVFGRRAGATGTEPTASWEMIVPRQIAAAPHDTSWGTFPDVNGDGYADVLIGADEVSNLTGLVNVYLGGVAGLGITPTTIAGPDGTIAQFGCSVASAGDVDGDGYADVIVGAQSFGDGTGRAYVFPGGPGAPAITPSEVLTGPDGASGAFGASVASAGDVNGDGYADVVVGANTVNGNAGRAYVYLGGPSGLAIEPAVVLIGPDTRNASFGLSVSGAGDVNGDGYGDIVVGAYGVNDAGAAYIYLGGPGGIAPAPTITLSGPGDMFGIFGGSVAGGGDVNGDGYADVVVGASNDSQGAGKAYVYHGQAAAPYLPQSPSMTLGPGAANSQFGSQVRIYDDRVLNGFSGVLVGAPGPITSTPGQVLLFRGSQSGILLGGGQMLTGPDGNEGSFGSALADTGDINGDSSPDLVVGAFRLLSFTGRAYLYMGSQYTFSSTPVSLLGPGTQGTDFGIAVAWNDVLAPVAPARRVAERGKRSMTP